MIAHKTKAAMPGRLSHNALLKRNQVTRLTAGGQTLRVTIIHTQINCIYLTQRKRNSLFIPSFLTLRTGAGGQNFTQLNIESADFIGFFSQRNSALTDFTQLLWQSPKVSFAYKTLILSTSSLWFVDSRSYKNSGGQPFGSSLAFLRWRRLISPIAAAIRKPAVLSPLFFTDSISSNTSCGTRTFTCFDLLFIEPVAITGSPCFRCYSLYAKKAYSMLDVLFT